VTDTLELPADKASPRQARAWAAPILDDCLEDPGMALVCVSELVANAVLHARTSCTLTVEERDRTLRITVRDHAPDQMPRMQEFSATAVTGRGLRILDQVATRWGVEHDDHSKSVWFEMPVVRGRAT
jgi:signal transduction histidine kinase